MWCHAAMRVNFLEVIIFRLLMTCWWLFMKAFAQDNPPLKFPSLSSRLRLVVESSPLDWLGLSCHHSMSLWATWVCQRPLWWTLGVILLDQLLDHLYTKASLKGGAEFWYNRYFVSGDMGEEGVCETLVFEEANGLWHRKLAKNNPLFYFCCFSIWSFFGWHSCTKHCKLEGFVMSHVFYPLF